MKKLLTMSLIAMVLAGTSLASDATKKWTKQWGASSTYMGYSVTTDTTGNIYVSKVTKESLCDE